MLQLGLPSPNIGFSQCANHYSALVARVIQIVNPFSFLERRANLGSTTPRVRSEPGARPLGTAVNSSTALGLLSD
jgi:hypothetical protein